MKTPRVLALSTLLLVLAPSVGLAYGLEEFNDGFGEWDYDPAFVGRTTTPGWELVPNDGEQAIRNTPTGTKFTYYWRLTRDFDLANTERPQLELKLHFRGAGYESVRVGVGPAGATRLSQFTFVFERSAATDAPEVQRLDLSRWQGQAIRVRLFLKKPTEVVEDKVGLYVHRIGVVTALAEQPGTNDPATLDVLAFNVQVFGRTKASKPEVMSVLARTIARYDVTLVQEIRDSTGSAITSLLTTVNAQGAGTYAMALSDRLGRTVSKEQYAFIYRVDQLSVLDSYHYDDGVEPDMDTFEREPFTVRFTTSDGFDFSMLAMHTSPEDAVAEIDALVDAYDDARMRWMEDDSIILGDLNADCEYVRDTEFSMIRLFSDARFTSHIPDSFDTTTGTTDCAYDRIVTAGEATTRVIAGTAQPFFYDLAYLLDPVLAQEVSDHYPVTIRLRRP